MIFTPGKVLLLLSAFPFLTVISNQFDVQPYFLSLLSLFVLREALRAKLVCTKHLILYLIFYSYVVASSGLNLIQQGYLSIAPMLGSIATLMLIPLSLFYIGRQRLFNPLPVIGVVAIIYFLVGALQLMVSKDLFSQFVSRGDTSELRGAFSLASEPYELARLMIVFMLAGLFFIKDELSRKVVWGIVFVSIVCVFLIAQSPAGIIALIAIIILINANNLKKVFLIFTSVSLIGYLILGYYDIILPKDTRIYEVLNLFHHNYEIFISLGGVAGRIVNLPHSLYVGFFETYGFGVGVGFSGDTSKVFYYDFLFGDVSSDLPIMLNSRAFGGVAGLFYEFGFFAFIFLFAVYLQLKYYLSSIEFGDKDRFNVLLVGLFVLFLFEGVLSNSVIFLFLYSALYSKKYYIQKSSRFCHSLHMRRLDQKFN